MKDRILARFPPRVNIQLGWIIITNAGLEYMQLPFQSPLRQSPQLRLVPRNAKKIAIIGPGEAHCKRNFAALNPNCEISTFSGISQFKADGSLPRDKGEYDCVLLLNGTSLEIGRFLSWTQDFLAADGVIALSIDNPFHLVTLNGKTKGGDREKEKRLQEIAEQSSQFSIDVRQQVKDAGFHVDALLSLVVSDAVFAKWQGEQGLKDLRAGNGLKSLLSFIRAPFFLYRLTKREFPKTHIQAQVLKAVGGVNDVRICEPMDALASLPGVTVNVGEDVRLSNIAGGGNKIFVWHRPVLTWEKSLSTIQQLRAAGYLIVTEFDDHYSPWPRIEQNQFLSFAGVHAVQTSTPELASLFQKFNPEVAVFPNQMNEVIPLREPKDPEKTRIFFGALNRQSDWKPIMGCLNKALRKVTGDFSFEVVFDREFYDALETSNKHFTPQCPYGLYKSKLLEADISLMPLLPNEFNRMKSDLKFVEAAGCGAIPVASEVVYGHCDPANDFSITCKTPEAYANALISLINDPGRRVLMQRKAHDYVKSLRLVCHHVDARYAWYQDLLSRKDGLDEALGRRLEARSTNDL